MKPWWADCRYTLVDRAAPNNGAQAVVAAPDDRAVALVATPDDRFVLVATPDDGVLAAVVASPNDGLCVEAPPNDRAVTFTAAPDDGATPDDGVTPDLIEDVPPTAPNDLPGVHARLQNRRSAIRGLRSRCPSDGLHPVHAAGFDSGDQPAGGDRLSGDLDGPEPSATSSEFHCSQHVEFPGTSPS